MIGENTNFNANQWSEELFATFQKKMKRMRIGSTGNLRDSFKKNISGSLSSPDKIHLEYLMYGAFVDMGVGKGDKAADAKYNRSISRLSGKTTAYSRRAKKWYNKTMRHYQLLMAEQVSADKGSAAVAQLTDTLPGKINIGD